MKKHNYITVLGKNDSQMPLDKLHEYGPIISVSAHMHDAGHLNYVWTREEKDLLWFLQQRPSPVECVTTPELYKKYVFYDQVHSFPPISPQFNLQLDNNTDDQTLALLSALGLTEKRILLVGYDISVPKVLWDLRSVIMLHPDMQFYFLCNPPKTKQLDHCSNAKCLLFKDIEDLKQ